MPELRKEVLQSRLRACRFGHTIRAYLPVGTAAKLRLIKTQAQRTLRDICMVILGVYTSRKGSFSLLTLRGKCEVMNFRVSDNDAAILRCWALDRHSKRDHFIGSIIHEFLQKVPRPYLIRVLADHEDIVARLKEEINARHGTDGRDDPRQGNPRHPRQPHQDPGSRRSRTRRHPA